MDSIVEQLGEVNRAALSYWELSGVHQGEVDSVCREMEHLLAMRIDFQDDGRVNFIVSREVDRRREGHFPSMAEFIFQALKNWPHPQGARGRCIVLLEDGLWMSLRKFSRRAPILAFGRERSDTETLLLPEPVYLASRGYENDMRSVTDLRLSLPWEARRPTVFWRGANSGVGGYGAQWEDAPRAQLVLAAQKFGDETLFDARISKLVGGDENISSREMKARGLTGPPVGAIEQFTYRYIVDVDGEMNAWSGYIKLASGSTVLKVMSDRMMWYYGLAKPWEHFVPAHADSASIIDAVRWIHAHPNESRAIAENAKVLTEKISYEASQRFSVNLIHKVLSLPLRQ